MNNQKKRSLLQQQDAMNRRTFLTRAASGIGAAALGSLMGDRLFAGTAPVAMPGVPPIGLPGLTRFPAKAKRVIYLFNSGGPSQMDLFDYKPKLADMRGIDMPGSVRMGQRLTGMTSGQKNFPIAPSMFKFAQHGTNGQWFSELLPNLAGVADDLCIIKSMYTEAINHDPAVTFLQSGSQIAGRPAIGSWFSYGLGSENKDLPAYVVMISHGKGHAPTAGRSKLGRGFPAHPASGGAIQRQRRSGPLPEQSPRGRPISPPGHARPVE